MSRDYKILKISNINGELSAYYPKDLLIPEFELGHNHSAAGTNLQGRTTSTIYESKYDVQKLRDRFVKARLAR